MARRLLSPRLQPRSPVPITPVSSSSATSSASASSTTASTSSSSASWSLPPFSPHSLLGVGATLAAAAAVGALDDSTSSSALRCDAAAPTRTDGSSVMMGVEDLTDDSELESPGEWLEFEKSHSVDVEKLEGLSVLVSQILAMPDSDKGASGPLFVQHNFNLGSTMEGYQCTVTSDSSNLLLQANATSSQGKYVLQPQIRSQLTPNSAVSCVGLFTSGVAEAGRVELKHSGPDFTTSLGVTADSTTRLGGTGVSLNYFQAVTHALAVGVDAQFKAEHLLEHPNKLWCSLYGRYMKPKWALHGRFDQAKSKASVTYFRQAAERLKLASTFSVNTSQMSTMLDVGYEIPIRVEEGSFPYTTVKGKLDSDFVFVNQVEHALLSGQGAATLQVSLDHFKQEYKLAMSLRLQC